jgi:hypothetical protein
MAIPTALSAVGTTPNSAHSSATATIGVRKNRLVTLVAWPRRISACSAFTARIDAMITT